MTRNQIEYWNLQETKRSNLAKEMETNRSNLANESLKLQQNVETERSNLAKEIETNRSNLAGETINTAKNVTSVVNGLLGLLGGTALIKGLGARASAATTKDDDSNDSQQGGAFKPGTITYGNIQTVSTKGKSGDMVPLGQGLTNKKLLNTLTAATVLPLGLAAVGAARKTAVSGATGNNLFYKDFAN